MLFPILEKISPDNIDILPIMRAAIIMIWPAIRYPTVPEEADIIIEKVDVPTAVFISSFNIKIDIIKNIIPPLAPSIPVASPTGIVINTISQGLIFNNL